jgi:ABC-type uncharacterized transport system involved in gliding motility auxiliary subunit
MKSTDTSNDWKEEESSTNGNAAAGGAGAKPSHLAAAVRRWLSGANTVVALLLAMVLLAMVNYLSARHYRRADVSRTHPYALSEKTRRLLASVSNTVEGTLFFRPSNVICDDVEALLREYEYACPKLHVEHVDPDREQTRAAELVRKYGLTRPNVVIFSSGGIDAVVTDDDMVEFDPATSPGGTPRRTGFLGEQAFSTAILRVTQPRQPVVYFLQGHHERDPRDRDQYAGFSSIARALNEDHIEARTLMLTQSNTVPADADAVVIAGPENKIAAAEIEALRTYLTHSGRLFVMLETRSDGGLSALLNEWGVRIGSGLVVDTGHSLSGTELFTSAYSDHPVTAPMTNVTVVFYLPRPLEKAAVSGADKPSVSPLIFTPATSWAETDLENKNMRFDAGSDRRGPLTVALAVEKGPVANVDIDIRPTRLVVIGDTDFASNGSLVGGNQDLFLNAINWLLERHDLMSVAAKPVQTVRLMMDQRQLSILFGAVVVALPCIVALAGVLMWVRRRS